MKPTPSFTKITVDVICYLYILLFVYAAVSKLIDFENFEIQIGQSPLLTAHAGFVAPAVIIAEIVLALALPIKKTRLAGLYGSLFLMMAFTVYIYLILNYSEFVPCSCGGVLERMGWTEHLIFNTGFVLIGLTAIMMLQWERRRPLISTALLSVLALFSASVTVIALFVTSENIIRKENNFTRRYLQNPLEEEKMMDLQLDSYYFAGSDDSHIYLGSYTFPFRLMKVDKQLTLSNAGDVHLERAGWKFRKFRFKVRPPYFYAYDGSIPVIYRGKLSDTIANIVSLDEAPFSQLQVISENKYAIVAQSRKEEKNIVGTLEPGIGDAAFNYNIIEKQQDGIFDTDGLLLWDDSGRRLTYGYFYRNTILHFDADLKQPKALHTIDTISRAQVSTIKNSVGQHKMDAPPMTVNKYMAVHKGVLFVESNLMGKFETREIWDNASVVDLYSTDTQLYLGSFFIGHRGKKKMSQILLTDSHAFVLIGNKILRYRMAQAITKNFKKGEAEKPNQSRHQLKLLNHEKN